MEDLNISSNSISGKNDFWLGSSKEKNNSLMRNRKKKKKRTNFEIDSFITTYSTLVRILTGSY